MEKDEPREASVLFLFSLGYDDTALDKAEVIAVLALVIFHQSTL